MSAVTKVDDLTYDVNLRLHLNPEGVLALLMQVAGDKADAVAKGTIDRMLTFVNGSGQSIQLTYVDEPVVWPADEPVTSEA